MNSMSLIYAELAASRVNVELMFSEAVDQPPFVTCRLRPWKGNRNASNMVLAGGYTADEALYYAYLGLYAGDYVLLDWSARATVVGVVKELAQRTTPQNAASRVVLDPQADFESFASTQSAQEKNGLSRPSQSRTEELRVAAKDMPKN